MVAYVLCAGNSFVRVPAIDGMRRTMLSAAKMWSHF